MSKKSIKYPYEIEPGLFVLAPEVAMPKVTVLEEVRIIMEGVNILNRWNTTPDDPFVILERLGYCEDKDGNWVPVAMTVDI